MARRLSLTFAAVAVLMLWSPLAARAQNPLVLDSCAPSAYLTAGASGRLTVNKQGQLCGIVTATIDTTGLATSANQTSQITQETAINTILGTVTASPTANTIADRLKTLNTTLGTPFQVGGSIGNTTFGATLSATPLVASGNGVVLTPTSEAAVGVAPVVSSALESNHVICAAACNFYGGYITTGATAGWLLLANATSAPTAAGAAIAPIACVLAPANQTTSIGGAGAPIRASTGIVMVFSTSGCLTNTASTTAYLSGQAK